MDHNQDKAMNGDKDEKQNGDEEKAKEEDDDLAHVQFPKLTPKAEISQAVMVAITTGQADMLDK